MTSRSERESASDSFTVIKYGLPKKHELSQDNIYFPQNAVQDSHEKLCEQDNHKAFKKGETLEGTKVSMTPENLKIQVNQEIDEDQNDKALLIPKNCYPCIKLKDFPKSFIRLLKSHINENSNDQNSEQKNNKKYILTLKRKLRTLNPKQTQFTCGKKSKINKEYMSDLLAYGENLQGNKSQYQSVVLKQIFYMLNNYQFIQQKIILNELFKQKSGKDYLLLLKICKLRCLSVNLLKQSKNMIEMKRNSKVGSLNIQNCELIKLQAQNEQQNALLQQSQYQRS